MITFFDRQPGGPLDVEPHGGRALARPPNLKPTGDAPGQQGAAGVKFRVPAAFDQHGAGVVDPIKLATVAEPAGLDLDPIRIAHVSLVVHARTRRINKRKTSCIYAKQLVATPIWPVRQRSSFAAKISPAGLGLTAVREPSVVEWIFVPDHRHL
jgi:hypothetical protein